MANGLARDRREGDVFCLFQQVSQTEAAAAAGVGRGDHRSSSFMSLILHFNGSNATKPGNKNNVTFGKENNENIQYGVASKY